MVLAKQHSPAPVGPGRRCHSAPGEVCCLRVQLPLGPFEIEAGPRGLQRVALVRGGAAAPVPGVGQRATPAACGDGARCYDPVGVASEAADQLLAYLTGRRRGFELPLDLSSCTEFQRRVLQACAAVPYGGTQSYGALAAAAGARRAARAAGQVMAHNRLLLVVPCHRIVAADGTLGGFGYGPALKAHLLQMEREGRGWHCRAAGAGWGKVTPE